MVNPHKVSQTISSQNVIRKIGVLFASYGDIDSLNELESYFKNSFSGIALDGLASPFREWLTEIVWQIQKEDSSEHYREFGIETHYRKNSQQQADIVEQKLRNVECEVKTYVGFNFTFPYISEALSRAQADNITELIVINHGSAYSEETTGLNFRDVSEYLKSHQEWDVKVTGVKSFARDERFIKLLGDKIEYRLNYTFGEVSPNDICIFLPIHGLPLSAERNGDPYISQTAYIIKKLSERFAKYSLQYGYQNHEYSFTSLFIKWTQPRAEDIAKEIAKDSWKNVLINGQISFTIDGAETLGDQAIELRKIICDTASNKRVYVEKMFNTDDEFTTFMKELILDVLQGQGDLISLSHY